MEFGRRQLFIYYRLPRDAAPDALNFVRGAQQALREEHPGLQARLLQKQAPPEEGDAGGEAGATVPAAKAASVTLMEIYAIDAASSPAGVDAALQALIEQRLRDALAPWVPPVQRHLEVFDEFLPCVS